MLNVKAEAEFNIIECEYLVKEEEIVNYPELILKEIEGDLFDNQVININANGMISGLRTKFDGRTKIGTTKTNIQEKIINDFIVNTTNNKNLPSNIFEIAFDPISSNYSLLCDNQFDESSVIFIRLENKLKITKRSIISLGDIHLFIDIDLYKNLNIEIVYQTEETKNKIFSKETKLIRIGRNKGNEIVLDNYAYSRVHTIIQYDDKDDNWYISDGFEGKFSTNGTWLYLDKEWVLGDKTYFRIGNSLIEIVKFFKYNK